MAMDDALARAVTAALRSVEDPDLHQDVVSLGFIHDLEVREGCARFELRLTTPACPARERLEAESIAAARSVPGVTAVDVRVTARTRSAIAADAAQETLRGVRNVVAVGSGKGGVGKSTTAVNLAYALADRGAKVALLDADLYGPSLHLMTDAPTPVAPDDGVLPRPPSADGVGVVSLGQFIPSRRPTLLRGPRVSAVLSQLVTGFDWGDLDYLIVDLPPGTGDVHLTLSQLVPLSGAVLVTTPQEVAVADVRKAAAMFRQLQVPILGVVETMSGFVCPCCQTRTAIFDEGGGDRVAAEERTAVIGRVPLDPRIVASGEGGACVVRAHPDSASAEAFRQAAGALAARLSVLAMEGPAERPGAIRWEST